MLKRLGFDSNVTLFHPFKKENYGWVFIYVRPKASWWQLLKEFTQAL
jgi:hypothetical protein